jgi:hypothetical protein
VYWFGEKFSLKICPDDVFGFPGVASCPEGTPTVCFYYCSVREITEAAKICCFFYFHDYSSFLILEATFQVASQVEISFLIPPFNLFFYATATAVMPAAAKWFHISDAAPGLFGTATILIKSM